MNEVEYKVKIITVIDAVRLAKQYDSTIIAGVGDRALVRYGKLLDPSLLELVKSRYQSIGIQLI